MEQIVNQIREAIEAAVKVIKSQRDSIADLRAKLAQISEEYSQFQQAESEEDAQADQMLQQLSQVSDALSSVVFEAQEAQG